MSASDSDHNYYSLEHRSQTSQSPPYHPFTPSAADHRHLTSTADTLPTLPAYSYRPPTQSSARRPSVSTSFEQYVSDAGLNGFTAEPPSIDNSPDPHDFYKQYRDAFGRDSIDGYGQPDIVVVGKEDGMTTTRTSQRPTPLNTRTNGFTPSPLASRVVNRSSQRSSSSPVSEKHPLSGAKSSPQLTSPAKNRQTQIQDLVNKFNQTPDELPPLPVNPSSRSTSATRSPGGYGSSQLRSRTPSDSYKHSQKITARPSLSGQDVSGKSSASQRKKHFRDETHSTPKSVKAPKSKEKERSDATNSYASQLVTDLNSTEKPSFRKPLFGEVLAVNTETFDPGYGIPVSRRRRGSEGSMHSPNPMFPDESSLIFSKISPSSPTAWYLGVTPSLAGIDLDKPIPARPPGIHRRSRSDFSSSFVRQPLASSLGKNADILSPPQESRPPLVSSNFPKRHSQSRIPISTRRMSATSDSGNSSPSTRANSIIGQSARVPPSKVINTLHKPPRINPNASSTDSHSRSSPARKSPKRRNLSPLKQNPGTNTLLNAYISAPLPMKSPPLRSSRPRQPVSTATTSASRARTAERLAESNRRENKSKNLPELGSVDFAARKLRIQQAFTKTVQENERKEEAEAERRRTSLLRESQYNHERAGTSQDERQLYQREKAMEQLEDLDFDDLQEQDEEIYATPGEEMPREDRELMIDTVHLADKSVIDLGQEDSPTLGVADRFMNPIQNGQGSLTPPSDAEPTSALTANTVDTFFDYEPQEEMTSPNAEHHRTLLSHVMSMREPSPATPPSTQIVIPTEDSVSDRDDTESIQIMLGETPIYEQGEAVNNLLSRGLEEFSDSNDNNGNRWSASSWTSSIRSKDRHSLDHERDTPMESINEHSSPANGESAHISLSTTVSSYNTQPWSPEALSTLSARSTMDSDGYNTISRVYDHYHDPNLISPEAISDLQQRLATQSPNLARAGGWDPKKVTQLYLQNLARTKHAQANPVPEPLRFANKPTTETSAQLPPIETAVADESAREFLGNPIQETAQNGHHKTPSTDTLGVTSQSNAQRASLNQREDWANTSPSFLDWIGNHNADTPTEEKFLSNLSERTRNPDDLDKSEITSKQSSHTSRTSSDGRLQLPEIQQTEGGLGIDIHVESPHEKGPPIAKSHPTIQDESSSSSPHLSSTKKLFASRPIDKPSPSSPGPLGRSRAPTIDPGTNPKTSIESLQPRGSGESTRQNGTVRLPAPRPGSTSRPLEHLAPDAHPGTLESSIKNASVQTEQKRLNRRRHIIKELVDTEHSFGQDMKVVDDIYKGTSNGLVISAEDVKILFGNSDQIVAFSTSFLDALKQAAKSAYVLPKSRRWRSKRDSSATSASGFTDDQSSVNGTELGDEEKDRKTFIGEAFLSHMTRMEKVYANYLKNHDAANQKLQVLQKSDKVQVWLNECRTYAHDLTTAWNLDSLLVKPVQRILKYPLLLKELCEVTPDNHPDFAALDVAAREMVGVSVRINEMKKRADIVEQVAGGVRKRKDSDVRVGISKAFVGRRTEKLKQQVGLSDAIQDREYNNIVEKFGLHFFQLQVVMRDVEMYVTDVQAFVGRFNDFVLGIEAHMDVGQTTYPEVESKWRKFRMSMREIQMTALTDHINAIRKNVIDPMTNLLRLHEGPEKLVAKRLKRLMDYARYRALMEKGDKPDKKTIDQKEQFIALNDTLKEELPRLFALTGRLVEACLNNFVQLQLQWQAVWRRKLSQAIDAPNVSIPVSDIIAAFAGDFQYTEAQVLSLGICNGSALAETANLVNFLSPTTTLNGDEGSPRQPSTVTLEATSRNMSQSSDVSPSLPQPDFGGRSIDSLGLSQLSGNPSYSASGNQGTPGHRLRADSSTSARSPGTPELPGSWRNYPPPTNPVSTHPNRPNSSTVRSSDAPSLPRLSVDTPGFRLSGDSQGIVRPPSTAIYRTAPNEPQIRPSPPPNRSSNGFHSALPMSDSPIRETNPDDYTPRQYQVLFLAASVYEFNIDRSRREAGYPYLTYIAGEIFDVLGEKGELWLARNQDDNTNQVGWIWNKHFAKLAS